MPRRCPRCGSVVPDGSLTCPQCYAEVPREEETPRRAPYKTREEHRREVDARKKSMSVSMALAIFPAFFGLLGLGLIYQDRRDEQGWVFFGLGLVIFAILVFLVENMGGSLLSSILLAISILFISLVYISTAVSAAASTLFGSFRIFGLRFRSVLAAGAEADGHLRRHLRELGSAPPLPDLRRVVAERPTVGFDDDVGLLLWPLALEAHRLVRHDRRQYGGDEVHVPRLVRQVLGELLPDVVAGGLAAPDELAELAHGVPEGDAAVEERRLEAFGLGVVELVLPKVLGLHPDDLVVDEVVLPALEVDLADAHRKDLVVGVALRAGRDRLDDVDLFRHASPTPFS